MTTPSESLDSIQRILLERARLLARPPAAAAAGEQLTLLVLTVSGERYGVEISFVREVQPRAVVTPVPGLPEFWSGLVNVRGQLYPVLNLCRYLALPAAPAESGKLLLVGLGGLSVALWVDDVTEVKAVPQAALSPALRGEGTDRQPDLVRGVTADLLAVLNIEVLLADPRLVVQDAAA
jgi:purine-binding chemotaxis protein CheW